MTLPRKMPVSAFSPTLMRLLVRGSVEEVKVDFTHPTAKNPNGLDRKAAGRLAARTQIQLYHLRSRMKDEKHPDVEGTYRTEAIRPKATPWILIVRPRDAALTDILNELEPSLSNVPLEAEVLPKGLADELLHEISTEGSK